MMKILRARLFYEQRYLGHSLYVLHGVGCAFDSLCSG